MSMPLQQEIDILKEDQDDDESYHITFDDLLEKKLMELDPEWMKAMKELYEKSGMARWYA